MTKIQRERALVCVCFSPLSLPRSLCEIVVCCNEAQQCNLNSIVFLEPILSAMEHISNVYIWLVAFVHWVFSVHFSRFLIANREIEAIGHRIVLFQQKRMLNKRPFEVSDNKKKPNMHIIIITTTQDEDRFLFCEYTGYKERNIILV